MPSVTLKTIEQNDNVGMFSICFDGNEESEFERFLNEFKDNATLNKDLMSFFWHFLKLSTRVLLSDFSVMKGK